ncbi:MAG: hypothetical protein QOD40_843 [Alphaproteobacteria bacterium]|jgi:hypothetical protein|nr:hypothetical protein [Alphaproteobacteria bacterium]
MSVAGKSETAKGNQNMEQDVAWRIIQAAFRCAADLQGLLEFLKENCSADEYRHYAMGIAAAVDSINVQLTDRALSAHPELADKIASDLAKFGHIT